MIVVDSSALLAVLFREPEKQAFQDAIAAADRCIISAVNAHETATVLRIRHGGPAVERLWQLLADNEIEIFPLTRPRQERRQMRSTGMEREYTPGHG